ncbi:transcriptional regulator GcvA [Bosea caraganae]|uniref:Transcriptional regulator GcvA n=1 Tax=Bosea caraganae TaxID=2763117 RepID=A0A370L973_9HYPH|nr:transcriptional regulator GcvA [Bosea caraganae]RDJ26950.1 transcriptional regulator GcvA [Bosea caraganae]RDJ30837.1 transcriptional regulator GcvA [Bosea caraganae]
MARNLPPLNALRAFEACARHASFTRAAQELCVTHGAVSRQVALLEDRLAVRLFTRNRAGTVLTSDGEAYFEPVRTALDIIADATHRLHRPSGKQALRLRVPPTFALRWLVPRLARFHTANRGIEVQITTSHEPADFQRGDVEACIQSDACGPTAAAGSNVCQIRLFGEAVTPVCSPALIAEGKLRDLRDLANHTLLSSTHRPNDWETWLAAAGLFDLDATDGIRFENSALSYQAAIDLAGITIAQPAFIQDDLRSGRLVEPFGIRAETAWAYYLVYPRDRQKPQALAIFEDWLLGEASLVNPATGVTSPPAFIPAEMALAQSAAGL